MILFIDHRPASRYTYVHRNNAEPWSPSMTASRPSTMLMTAFVLAAAILVTAALSPVVQLAASVAA
jgi:hypothetical protein